MGDLKGNYRNTRRFLLCTHVTLNSIVRVCSLIYKVIFCII